MTGGQGLALSATSEKHYPLMRIALVFPSVPVPDAAAYATDVSLQNGGEVRVDGPASQGFMRIDCRWFVEQYIALFTQRHSDRGQSKRQEFINAGSAKGGTTTVNAAVYCRWLRER